MQILTNIGEQGVHVGERFIKFRPSFYAMSQLGSPADIVRAYVEVCGQPTLRGAAVVPDALVRQWLRNRFAAAVSVLYACAEPDVDISWLVGYTNERFKHVPGVLPMADIVGLAIGLLKHGIVGDVKAAAVPTGKKSYTDELVLRDFVAAAMAHLGASEAEAWQMTMTGYLAAMRSKFPPPKGEKAPPSEDEHDHVMGWLAKINKARAEAANHG